MIFDGLASKGAEEFAKLALLEVDAVAEPVVVIGALALGLGFRLLEGARASLGAGVEAGDVRGVVVGLPLRRVGGRAFRVAAHEPLVLDTEGWRVGRVGVALAL